MPGTDSVTVVVAAQAGAFKVAEMAKIVRSFFMTFSFQNKSGRM